MRVTSACTLDKEIGLRINKASQSTHTRVHTHTNGQIEELPQYGHTPKISRDAGASQELGQL